MFSGKSATADAAASTPEKPRTPLLTTDVHAISASQPPVGAGKIEHHLRLGDQALSQHSQEPARLTEARAHFEEVLRVDPQHPVAHHRLAVIADLTKDFPRAERHYALALRSNPRDPQLLHDIGYSYMLQGRHAEAIPYLQESLAVAPGFEMAARKLADAYVQTRQVDLARQTLQQILPEEQAREELARLQQIHDPAARPSLFGRMRQNLEELRPEKRKDSDPMAELLAELEQARQEGERARHQREAGRPFTHTSPAGADPPVSHAPVPDSQLSSALAQIDRAGRSPIGQPLLLDGPARHSGPFPDHGSGASDPSQTHSGIAPGGAGGTGDLRPRSATGATMPGHDPRLSYAAGAPMASGEVPLVPPGTLPPASPGGILPTEYQQTGGVITAAAPPPAATHAGQFSAPGGFVPAEMIRGTERGTTLRGMRPPGGYAANHPGARYPAGMSGGIQPAGGRWTPGVLGPSPTFQGDSPTGVTNAEFQTPAWSTPSIVQQTPGPAADSRSAAAPASGADGRPGATPAPYASASSDDYQAAAALGMGLGPGRMFPVLPQTERVWAGTNSVWNGGLYPAPSRHLPTDRPPADLSRAYADLSQGTQLPGSGGFNPAAAVPPPNSHGQQMPAGGHVWTQLPPYHAGPANRNGFEGTPPATLPADSPLQSYDQFRTQFDAANNAVIQQTYGQYPSGQMVTPSYGIPVERPPAPAAQMAPWYGSEATLLPQHPAAAAPAGATGIVTPEAYSSAGQMPQAAMPPPWPGPAPQVRPSPVSSRLPPPEYAPGVVAPPPYRGGGSGGWSGSDAATGRSPDGIQPAGAAANYSGPLIVPAH